MSRDPSASPRDDALRQIDSHARVLWDYLRMNHQLTKADAILCLGSNDLRVGTYAAELFQEGWAPLLVYSGGKGRLTSYFPMAEADLFAQHAREMGVPEENILIENQSTNTGENIRFTYNLLQQRKIRLRSLIVVQKPYMERRSYATFKKQWPGPPVDFMVTSPRLSFEEYPNADLLREHIINILVGDLQRMKVYAELGFQIPQDIPPHVWHAYEQLVKAGYTKHLVL